MIEHFKRVLQIEGEALFQCLERLKNPTEVVALLEALEIFKKTLNEGGKILLTGIGKSGKIAEKIAATLASTGSSALFIHPTEALHGDLGHVRPQDSLLALSHTGNTQELLDFVRVLKNNFGIPVIGLGGNPQSQLAGYCNAWIDGSVAQEACTLQLAPTASTTLALALGDAFAITLMKLRGGDTQDFAKNHPGGGLGKRLSLKVETLMHKGEEIPGLPPQASMDEVLLTATQKKLGTVLVIENGKLLGIITDGDLRRALKHREKIFQFCASEVMTQKPVFVYSHWLASQALELMENRPSKISVLPVLNEQDTLVGILHIHDILRAL